MSSVEILQSTSSIQLENEILIKLICEIRGLTKGKVISLQENNYHPSKNLSKQEVYESFVKIQALVKGNFPFLSDEKFIEELLDEK